MRDVLIKGHWFDKALKRCNEEQLKEVCYLVIKYGLFGDEDIDTDDEVAGSQFDYIKEQIKLMQNSYDRKAEFGKKIGRKSTFDESENAAIYELAVKGYTVPQIAQELGIQEEKKIKAIYNAEGWKRRKCEKFSEN